jgi:putative flippase GtrA
MMRMRTGRARVTVVALDAAVRPSPAAAQPAGRPRAEFVRYCAVGASGYAVNSALFWLLDRSLPYTVAFAAAFVCAATSNFGLNRAWTFRSGGRVSPQYARFLAVSLLALGVDLLVLSGLVELAGASKLLAAAAAILAATPASFAGNRLWTFRRRPAPA